MDEGQDSLLDGLVSSCKSNIHGASNESTLYLTMALYSVVHVYKVFVCMASVCNLKLSWYSTAMVSEEI